MTACLERTDCYLQLQDPIEKARIALQYLAGGNS